MGFDLYDINSGQPHGTIRGKEDQVVAVGVSKPLPVLFVHDGRALLSGSHTGAVHLWDVESKKIVQTLRHASESLKSCDLSHGH